MTSPVDGDASDARTRPAQADRKAARRGADVQRYTVDLNKAQRRTLTLWSAEWDVDKSKVIRTLLYLLEADAALRSRVQAELFTEDEPTPNTSVDNTPDTRE